MVIKYHAENGRVQFIYGPENSKTVTIDIKPISLIFNSFNCKETAHHSVTKQVVKIKNKFSIVMNYMLT